MCKNGNWDAFERFFGQNRVAPEKSISDLLVIFFAEMIGTAIMIFIGCLGCTLIRLDISDRKPANSPQYIANAIENIKLEPKVQDGPSRSNYVPADPLHVDYTNLEAAPQKRPNEYLDARQNQKRNWNPYETNPSFANSDILENDPKSLSNKDIIMRDIKVHSDPSTLDDENRFLKEMEDEDLIISNSIPKVNTMDKDKLRRAKFYRQNELPMPGSVENGTEVEGNETIVGGNETEVEGNENGIVSSSTEFASTEVNGDEESLPPIFFNKSSTNVTPPWDYENITDAENFTDRPPSYPLIPSYTFEVSPIVGLSFGLGVMIATQIFAHISLGHFNPAITLAAFILCKS